MFLSVFCLFFATFLRDGFLLAHLSLWLVGELIVWEDSVGVCRLSTFSNIFSSKTTGPVKAKFHGKPPWTGGTKVCLRDLGHMTKMAAMTIYD